jgi:hypothetical protein
MIQFLLLLPLFAEIDLTNFDLLMGKDTPHWQHIQQPEDIHILQTFKTLYEKNFPLQNAAYDTLKIPKVVHFIWLGPRAFPPESVENIRTWIAHHPDWTFKFWTDRDRPAPVSSMQVHRVQDFRFLRLADCYAATENYGEKSDLLRYEILYQEGGIYADHDANCLRPFHNLNGAYDFYCCLETPHPAFAGFNITAGMGVLASRPDHPILANVIDLIHSKWAHIENTFRGNDPYTKVQRVMNRTYIALTDALKAGTNQNGNVDIILPSAYFFAKTGLPSIYSKHFYATAWANPEGGKASYEKHLPNKLSKLAKRSHNLHLLAIALLALNAIAFLILRKKKA